MTGCSCRDLLGGHRHLAAADRYLLHRLYDLLGGGALLLGDQLDVVGGFHHPGQQGQAVLHLLGTLLHGHDRCVALGLGAFDDACDLGRRRLGSLGKPAHLVGYNGETSACIPRARGLDGCVESQKVGLVCDLVDQPKDLVDVSDPPGQRERALA